ncbi:O-antigen ligase family protein [Chlorogloeopsis fritschii PCC 9212]|uniref:O-antigen ligase-related domain-containing protein n=1 Tax=Chlorogloeopsis fritschii PCC 6912 TaxID=211165 RepID=A0A3S0Y124_CHLFR|nr:O-antigen ligase family protein [Chlorogloeopsis fritschii]RUR83026.1 hypothetical protein PCC6912_24000 [Chlorogloeopsis fritschii PCC 6912]
MLSDRTSSHSSRLALLVGLAGVGVGIVAGFLAGAKPLLLLLALIAVPTLIFFFARFEQAVLGLLIVRSALDVFSAQQIPAAFGIGLILLTLLYVTIRLLTGQAVRTDWFCWFFTAWIILQGLWLILLPLGALGLDASFLPMSIRDWMRTLLWPVVYWLVMQLKGRIYPEKAISLLFLSAIAPFTVASMQLFVPPSFVPFLLSTDERIKGTFAHPNVFATYLLLFIALTCWKLERSHKHWPWLLLLGVLAFFFVSTRALFSLAMLVTFVLGLLAPRLSLPKLIGGAVLLLLVIGLFVSTEFGQERLLSLTNTPLLNPDIDISRAILLSQGDHNSFNWRISQWDYLLRAWQQFPMFGYGIGLSIPVAGNGLLPHNDYVRALVEGGVVGLVSFLTLFGAMFLRLIQLLRYAPSGSAQQQLCLILLAFIPAILVGMITENIWSHTTLFFYLSALLAIAGWNWNEPRIT